jgi:hypothetical protein
MNSDDVISQAEALTFDIPDDVLEQTASAQHRAFTLVYCTNTRLAPLFARYVLHFDLRSHTPEIPLATGSSFPQ